MSAAGIPDGSYTGVCDVGYIYAKVRVEVSDGKITDIKLLEHRNERGSAAEQVVGKMVQQQNVHAEERKAAGEKFCDCEACAAAAAIIDKVETN